MLYENLGTVNERQRILWLVNYHANINGSGHEHNGI